MNYFSVDVDITAMASSSGIPYSMFDPNNPFIRRNYYQPLPYWDFNNKFDKDREVYWVVEEELTITPPSLDLKKAFNCFDQIPSAGAHYSIKLCVDVSDNNNPMRLPPQTGSETGHSFLVVTKSNGTKHITQVFGFYAQKFPGYFFPFRSVSSTIKNNQLREINASIEMGLTEIQFQLLREKAFELAKHKFAAVDYNCTNFGMDLFNSLRAKPITIDSYTVYLPTNNSFFGSTESNRMTINKTPQMLFKKLKEIKESKVTEASCIVIDTTKHTKAPLSHGECN